MVIEETERLIIKEIEFSEAKEAAGLLSLFPCETEKSYTEEMVNAYINLAYGFYGYGYWGLYERESGEFIGISGFREGSYPLEAGYVVRSDKRGLGYAAEALEALVRFAKEEFMWVVEDQEEEERNGQKPKEIIPNSPDEKVYAIKIRDKILIYGRTAKSNIASQKVLLNNGFTEIP